VFRFLPTLAKDTLEKIMDKNGVLRPSTGSLEAAAAAADIKCSVAGDTVTIGQTTARRHAPETRGKVPETLFYDTPQNLAVMEAMLQDFLLGEHLLLVGNQAIGIRHNYIIVKMWLCGCGHWSGFRWVIRYKSGF
jgi:von Willebrand factor A domain-containing protein 8